MKALVSVVAMFKPEFPDPNSRALLNALKSANYEGILALRMGKEFRIALDVESKEQAHQVVDDMCKQLLAHRVTENYEFTIEFEEEKPPVLSQVDLDEIEIKFPMGEKLILLGETKDLTDEDCVFLVSLLYDYHKSGRFQAWLDRETRMELIERADKVFKRLFGRANKCIFTDGQGTAFADLLFKSVDAKYATG